MWRALTHAVRVLEHARCVSARAMMPTRLLTPTRAPTSGAVRSAGFTGTRLFSFAFCYMGCRVLTDATIGAVPRGNEERQAAWARDDSVSGEVCSVHNKPKKCRKFGVLAWRMLPVLPVCRCTFAMPVLMWRVCVLELQDGVSYFGQWINDQPEGQRPPDPAARVLCAVLLLPFVMA